MWSTWVKLVSFIKPYWFWVVVSIVAALASAGVDVLAGYFIKTITDNAVDGLQQELLRNVYLIALAMVVGSLAKYGVKYASGRFSALALRDIRKRTMANVVHMPMADVEAGHSGDIVSRLTNDAGLVQGFFQNNFANFIYQPILFLATFTYLLILDWRLLLLIVIVEPVAIGLVNIFSKPLGDYTRTEQEGFGKLNAIAQDSIGGIYMSKAFNLEQTLYRRFKGAIDQILSGRLQFERRSANMMPLFIAIRAIPTLSIAGLGGYLAVQGDLTPGTLFAFIFLMGFLIQPLMVIPELIGELRRATAAADRIFEIYDHERERTTGETFLANPDKPILEGRGLTFAYDGRAIVLKHLNFHVHQGKTIALVGQSGSGKSTIFKLLCGFYTEQAGHLTLYTRDYRDWALDALRKQFSLVEQDTYLFPATIAENIAYGQRHPWSANDDSDITMNQVIAAAQAANAHDFITRLPEGYQTQVGERGNRLSGGQRQRVGIARAVLRDAPILLLDEPTSALDTESEALVQEALERFMQGRTTLIIAHRLSTIQRANEIWVLDQGHIVEQGTHQSLMARDGLYRQLYLKQSQDETTPRRHKGPENIVLEEATPS